MSDEPVRLLLAEHDAHALGALVVAARADERRCAVVSIAPSALFAARRYVAANTGYLARNGIAAHVAGIAVNQALRQVEVTVVADVSSLFPGWVPRAVIRGRGVAEVRGRVE